MVFNFWVPLGSDVFKRRWRGHAEAYQKNVCLRVRQRSQSVVILLARRVPQSQADGDTVDNHWRRIVVKTNKQEKLKSLS